MIQPSLPYWLIVRRPVFGKALGVAKSLNPALDAEMMLEREERRIVERAQREVDHVAVRIIERQRSEEHTSELQSHMRISYAVLCLKTKNTKTQIYRADLTM